MRSLKVINLSIIVFTIFFVGCATSSYKIINQKNMATEIEATPDRIIMECERVETDDRGVVAGFMIHVINDKNKSITIVQTNALDIESCETRFKKIDKIIKNGKKIYLAGIGDVEEPHPIQLYEHNFPHHGIIQDSGGSLQFIAIQNELKQCFGAFSAEEKPCPPEPFPLKK